MSVGFTDDGRPMEVRLTTSKVGADLRAHMDALGFMASVALQYGAPIDTIKRHLALAYPELGKMLSAACEE